LGGKLLIEEKMQQAKQEFSLINLSTGSYLVRILQDGKSMEETILVKQ
jgi:hypothetical protein